MNFVFSWVIIRESAISQISNLQCQREPKNLLHPHVTESKKKSNSMMDYPSQATSKAVQADLHCTLMNGR